MAGDVYEGEFSRDKKEGPGTLTLKNGEVICGIFKDDKFERAYEDGEKGHEGHIHNASFLDADIIKIMDDMKAPSS